ncbi:MAG TPA: hypothetical protein VFI39_06730 [Gemmatimonadales bacterium]|nr:hypothetical protein [Gemmatimonadales bacterium]
MRCTLAAALLVAAPLAAQSPVPLPTAQPPSWSRAAIPFQDRRIPESSGVVVSRLQPGVLWTFNDSGNPPDIFATDTAGRARGRWRIIGAEDRDWEAMAIGPGPCRGGECLYIGEIGDNDSRYSAVALYQLDEPIVTGRDDSIPYRAKLVFRYPDGPHDAESLIVDSTGDAYVITKPRVRRPEVFRIPASAWRRRDTVVAELTDSLDLDPRAGVEMWATDASLAPDGRTVALRTYSYLYLYRLEPDGHFVPIAPAPLCTLTGLGAQGEGVAWLDTDTFVLTSEKFLVVPASIAVARCAH